MTKPADTRSQTTPTAATWRPPTRRAFVAMLGAAAASLALREKRRAETPPRSTWAGTTRWIGHC